MRNVVRLLFCSFAVMSFTPVSAQNILKKIKQKAEQVTNKAIDKKVDQAIEKNTGISHGGEGATTVSRGRASNKSGAGLITTPPDVNQNLGEAESAFKANNYGEARYAVQQAMLGVEMEIGKKILKSLPEVVSGLNFVKEDDQVTSTGWGWVGLTIQRKYGADEKQLTTVIANNSMWMAAINLYLTSGGYAQTSGDKQNWKQTKVKGNRAVIEFSDSSGYKLTVPIGQSSLIIWEGVNFATEADVMSAANSFDIDEIKKTLGEK